MMFTNPEIGMIQLCSFIGVILLGFPIAFTLVAMGVFFGYYAMGSRIFDLLITNTYDVMSNDVLTAVPLFLFMGYVVERSNILDRLFYSLQMSMRRVPGALAVATLITCALFATATGIVGAVVTLMGLLAFPAMLRAGYNTELSAGVVCAGGCLGIMIPPSVLLILYGATTSVSVVQLYAAAFLPGFLLAGLYVVYVIVRVLINPSLAPKPKELERDIPFREVFGALLTSFFPLAILILSVLGAILLGLATPSEAAAVGALGSVVLAAGYRSLTFQRLKEAVYLTARTSAMVCYLFIGSWTFSSVFSYLGGHEVIERWVIAANLGRDRIPHPGPVHHLLPWLAAGVDRDHHHLRPDLPAAGQALQYRPDFVRHPGRAQHPDIVQYATDGDGRVLPQRRGAAACAAEPDFRRRLAVRVHGVPDHDHRLRVPGHRPMAAWQTVCELTVAEDATSLTAIEAAERIANGDISAEDYTSACLDRIAAARR